MKKFCILIFSLAIIGVLIIAHYKGATAEAISIGGEPTFVQIEQGKYWNIYYHRDTKVVYIMSRDPYNSGTFTPLYNSDGTLMIYEEDIND